MDKSRYKHRLEEYLNYQNIKSKREGSVLKFCCPNPAHNDETPSAVLYDNNSGQHLTCLSQCDATWDIFDVAGLIIGSSDFKDQLKHLEAVFGDKPEPEKKPISEKKDTPGIPMALEKTEADKLYTRENVERIRDFSAKKTGNSWGPVISNTWKYTDRHGRVIGLDVKFTGGEKKKAPITFWTETGKHLKTRGAPVLIYNLHEIINSDKPVLIHEGCKCAELGRQLTEFTTCSWSGGANKASKAPWHFLEGKEVFIFRDNDGPGAKAAAEIKKHLPNAKIVPIMEKIKDIPKSDIEQALEHYTPEEITRHIFENSEVSPSPSSESDRTNSQPVNPSTGGGTSESLNNEMPFKILGTADDGNAYFLNRHNRLYKSELDKLSKNKLMTLAPRWWWKQEYSFGEDNKLSWDVAIDDIIEFSGRKDFNPDVIRGRGAWRGKQGICYHDGKLTTGNYDENEFIFMRKEKHDIGISETPASEKLRHEIKNIVFEMSFESKVDAIRALGWSVLAPFCGALKWRPAILVTGDSGSGKTTLANFVIRKLADPLWLDGRETTPAYLRGRIDRDSRPVFFEEAEPEEGGSYGKDNRTELFSIMRVSTSDDAPDTGKGTKDGGFRSSKMLNMFGFISVDPTINKVADENRIFRINMVKSGMEKSEWDNLSDRMNNAITEENCRSVRAFTWSILTDILKLADELSPVITAKSGKDFRTSYADAMLCAAFIMVWHDKKITPDKYDNFFEQVYKLQKPENNRNTAQETVERILDERIEIIKSSGKREKLTIQECLNRIFVGITDDYDHKDIKSYEDEIARYGVRLIEKTAVAICNKHHEIMRIINRGDGYGRLIGRHPNCRDKSKSVRFPDRIRKCTIIGNVIPEDLINDQIENEGELGF